ncbi:MAG: hypothetical protein ACI9WC_001846 [Arenicella sp.]|jgi:hypothetical protein
MNLLKNKSNQKLGLLAILGLLCTSPSQASNSEIIEQLKSCAQIQQDADRVACYEQLGKSVLSVGVQAPIETATTPPQVKEIPTQVATQGVLPDSLGGGDFSDRAGVKIETNRGRVSSCKKASDRKWFYIFDNGQVWKQVDSRKRHYKSCDFFVTVSKDSFGYTMVIDGQDGKVRIDRRR